MQALSMRAQCVHTMGVVNSLFYDTGSLRRVI
jgi:hypothetical protein